ncbi:hypothetical protein OH77DRAFT_1393838 [Trametes cingulata]|nr:hypothetical protein OH77DRAFT_1393838 [Trametes cingulata]
MLVLHPNSRCDVCLDNYTATREPYTISCGHVFCRRCLQSLVRPSCPLCRTHFDEHEVRRLHVDKATLPPATPQLCPPDLDAADRARQFQTQLTRMIRGGATASDLYEVQSELKPWLSTQGPDDVRFSSTHCGPLFDRRPARGSACHLHAVIWLTQGEAAHRKPRAT